MISLDMVVRLFDYDGEALVWRHRPISDFKDARSQRKWNTRFVGKRAGWKEKNGYVRICVNGQNHPSHRLIFLRERGWIPEEIDHINHIRDDNRIANLRPADRAANCKNVKLPVTNTSGRIGVYRHGRKWQARIVAEGVEFTLGTFRKFDDACAARAAAETAHGFHKNHGLKP